MTGVQAARHEHIIVADDDVRYRRAELERMLTLLQHFEVVRPQNIFRPQPWHARWDTARSLLNRLAGGDWPGTLGVRRSVLLDAGGYSGDVLFENLEMVRTIKAAGTGGGAARSLRDAAATSCPAFPIAARSPSLRRAGAALALCRPACPTAGRTAPPSPWRTCCAHRRGRLRRGGRGIQPPKRRWPKGPLAEQRLLGSRLAYRARRHLVNGAEHRAFPGRRALSHYPVALCRYFAPLA